ncbi:hypothetical protein [uncultured Clostridium sp.]|uniref:hypothetical protein n=1 Tax=uncultured Clostridium sp. TaxID=59620 RepID=UPI00262DC82B|nr:hypothetical protein [uncultured Clostridium sp.]
MSSILCIILFGANLVLTFLVTLGMPLGEYTLGGNYKVLPNKLRIFSGISLIIQLFAMIIILEIGGFITTGIPLHMSKFIFSFIATYLSIKVISNLFSKSKKEKYIMTPLSLITSICFWLTIINF